MGVDLLLVVAVAVEAAVEVELVGEAGEATGGEGGFVGVKTNFCARLEEW